MSRRPPPSRQHHEGVIHPDTQEQEWRRQVEGDELHSEVAAQPEPGGRGQEGGGSGGRVIRNNMRKIKKAEKYVFKKEMSTIKRQKSNEGDEKKKNI